MKNIKDQYLRVAKKITATSNTRLVLGGIYHRKENETAYATNGQVMLVCPPLYEPLLAGLIISPKTLAPIDGSFPNVDRIDVPAEGHEHNFKSVDPPRALKIGARGKAFAYIMPGGEFFYSESKDVSKVHKGALAKLDLYYAQLVGELFGFHAVGLCLNGPKQMVTFYSADSGVKLVAMPVA